MLQLKINIIMRTVFLSIIFSALSLLSTIGNTIPIKSLLVTNSVKVYSPVFNNVADVDNNAYKEFAILEALNYSPSEVWPVQNSSFTFNGKSIKYFNTEASDSIGAIADGLNLFFVTTYVDVDRFTIASLKLKTDNMFICYLDNEKIGSKNSFDSSDKSLDLKLYTGKHRITFAVLVKDDNLNIAPELELNKKSTDAVVKNTIDPIHTLDIITELSGDKIQSAEISPSGKYILVNYSFVEQTEAKSTKVTVIVDTKTKQNVAIWRNHKLQNIQWLPTTDRLSYIVNFMDKSDFYVYDIATRNENLIARGLKDMDYAEWAKTEKFVIYSVNREADKWGDLKRVFGAEDRLAGFRDRSYLYMLDVNSGITTQLTSGNLSASLNDIHPSGTKILFSTSKPDYLEVPFSKQNMYEMNLADLSVTEIWKDKTYDGYCTYSPDGTKLLVQGSPETFGEIGLDILPNTLANSYDTQLYLFDIKTKAVEAITKKFDPSVKSTFWADNNTIYFTVDQDDRVNLYKYSLKDKKFAQVKTSVDVIRRVSYAKEQSVALYYGTSITTPNKLYTLDLKKEQSSLFANPAADVYSQVKLGKTEDWNFVNKQGTTISGRVYYPPNFDSAKKYPVIVYYYGGTSTVTRDFGGRYPKNIWAANGYIVYVLQPSGTTGFGQKFSSLHVNGWGKEAIDDIIDGTKQFLASHTNADAANVGCLGASYGGFTTMMLQTRTDIFKTAISHAGISDISSYWGEGNWGYTYSSGASKNSYPWNNQDLYVKNSPLFNADKLSNSILLIHGTVDDNVPTGESLQYYMALKLCGKDAELVLVKDESHFILKHDRRVKWHYTILGWFDKKLKEQPALWNDLYPEKNL